MSKKSLNLVSVSLVISFLLLFITYNVTNANSVNHSSGSSYSHNNDNATKPVEYSLEHCADMVPFGNPTVKGDDKGINICHKAYMLQYNPNNKSAFWSAYKLTVDNLSKPQGVRKSNPFQIDPFLIKNKIPYVKPDDYKNPQGGKLASCFDKGHIAPAGHFQYDSIVPNGEFKTAVEESFFMSNMVPQHSANNRQVWRMLEENSKNWVLKGKRDLYIISGPIFASDKVITYNNLPVPTHLFKVIIDKDNKQSTAFLLPNYYEDKPFLGKYRTSVDELQKVTGIDFLHGNKVTDNPQAFVLKPLKSSEDLASIPDNCAQYYYYNDRQFPSCAAEISRKQQQVPPYECSAMYAFGNSPLSSDNKAPIICHKGHALQYNANNKAPYWVAEKLTTCQVTNLLGKRSYVESTSDPKIVELGLPSVDNSIYVKTSGKNKSCYDQGHMVPTNDLHWDELVNIKRKFPSAVQEGFYLSNIVPQNPHNNREIWLSLEESTRYWASSGRDLYIITGPIYSPKANIFFEGVRVPDKLYKIIVDKDKGEYVAFVVPNQDIRNCLLKRFSTSIEDIQKQTGINFNLNLRSLKRSDGKFPILLDPIKNCNPKVSDKCVDLYYKEPLPEDNCVSSCYEDVNKNN